MQIDIETKSEVAGVLKIVGGVLAMFLVFGLIMRSGSLGACGVADRTLDADNINISPAGDQK